MSDQVKQVKQRTDIVQIIGNRVELKPAGKYLKGLCPFHGEKSPSFFVSPDMQMYKCFGCGKSGDVYTFLQDYEGMNFRETLEILAEKVGITLETRRDTDSNDLEKRLKAALNLAQEFYHFLLTEHPAGQLGRDYLQSRQIGPALVRQFNLGFAPESWHSLEQYLIKKKGFDLDILDQAGLIVRRDEKHYDRFRSRLMFPLTDFRGQVVGFSGRVLSAETKEAKYINTPETRLYHKRELLFGLHQARAAARKKDQLILVEGEFDVISSVQAGVLHIAGIKGSALTEDHVRLILRLTRNVILCLDADTAGDAATKRGIEIADKLGMNIFVLALEGDKDPDDLARQHPQKWKELVKHPISIYQYYINSAFKHYNAKTGVGKKQITDELVPVLARIHHPVERSHYIQILAQGLKVASDLISKELVQFEKQQKVQNLTAQTPTKKNLDDETEVESQLEQLERRAWSVWLQADSEQRASFWTEFTQLEWVHPGLKRLNSQVTDFSQNDAFDLRQFGNQLPTELAALLQQLYLADVALLQEVTSEQIHGIIRQVKQAQLKHHIQQLRSEISSLENQLSLSADEQQRLRHLQQQVSSLIQRLKAA